MVLDPTDRMTPQEAAAYLGIKPATLASWRSSGRRKIPYLKIGRRVVYRRSDLDAWLSATCLRGFEVGEE